MKTVKSAASLVEVRDQLCQMAADVMSDRNMCVQIHEGANALGKVIGSCKVYLEHCALAEIKPEGEWSRFITDTK
jgi:hypothetical protein